MAALAVGANGTTAFLLWVRSRIAGSIGLAGMGLAYAYAAALGVPYLLAVPLMIGPPGHASHLTQASWVVWHLGFPLGVFATVIALRRVPERLDDDRIDATLHRFKRWALVVSAAGILTAVLYSQTHPTDAFIAGYNVVLVVLNAGMIVAFFTVRPLYRALGPWICAALTTGAFEVVSRVLAGQAYTAGWYAARIEMVLASTIVLLAMLADIDRVYRRMSRLVTHDYLTGLLNRATFETRFDVALGYAMRNRTPLAFIGIDVDHFKGFNDRYGHTHGDRVLQAVAAAIGSAAARASDVAGRIGGEEFGLILGVADLEGARIIAERILASVAETRIPHEGEPTGNLSVSIGIGYSERLTLVDKLPLQEAADAALYVAKRNGRGQSAYRVIDRRGAAPP